MKRQRKNALSPEVILHGYHIGIFPMADSANGEIRWYLPKKRAIIPLDEFKVARSLRQVIKKGLFEVRINCNFEQVIKNCAAPREDDEQTWISHEIMAVYTELHYRGFAHSVESYYQGELAGGLYGVSIGGVFFGESMFYRVPNASKVALHALVSRLRDRDFDLLDSQFMNENVKRFGAIEISHDDYMARLQKAIYNPTAFV
ncbi:leucyl/phenylalanyl-tRNA/protein transferase [Chloroherpeton thalassium ATCC 35110]|uniref:Leucyl/phenylalanyl-tRNA--protein transferase n=1 Tax=Chloroherpeton thalassium (strain ATCC 35110 / GB-78) TaxID=517418 RepID=B3QVQ1_CHLT3|nr:leucyl/phenylalanyl-tRNA--protein transferase [Chloroherpeton thalassium]ACF13108.1 leucyl/phenylalanyl-tRNA/protein transferase [Chloroherpeton thalassium ATCC 35110]